MRIALFFTAFIFFSGINANSTTFFPFAAESPCITCNTPDGLATGSITDATATLTWNTVTDATQYYVEVQNEKNTPGTFLVETTVTGTSYTVTGLQTGVLYKFKVRARCGSNKSDWSGWFFFKSGSSGGTSGPCPVPNGLTASVNGSIATLSWNAVLGALKYTIEVEDEQNAPSIFHLEDSAPVNSYTLSGVKPGVLYKFKVRTSCAGGNSDWSTWIFFNGAGSSNGGGTSMCSAPTQLSVQVNAKSAQLSWNKVSGATQYYIEVEDEQNIPSNFQVAVSTQDSFYSLTGLTGGTHYKFKVRANCAGGGYSDWSVWQKFQTAVFLVNLPDPSTENRSSEGPAALASSSIEMQVWPNPAQSMANVRLQGLHAASVNLQLINLAGRVIQTQAVYPESETWTGSIQVDGLPGGLYLLKVDDGQSTQTLKLVVNRR